MTFQINHTHRDSRNNDRVFCMFDIEYYLTQAQDKNIWFSEICCLPIVEGLSYFLKDKLDDCNFDYKEFIKDANEIQEIRGLLYERYNNKPKSIDDARDFHYHIFGDVLNEILDNFCIKYKLSINID